MIDVTKIRLELLARHIAAIIIIIIIILLYA